MNDNNIEIKPGETPLPQQLDPQPMPQPAPAPSPAPQPMPQPAPMPQVAPQPMPAPAPQLQPAEAPPIDPQMAAPQVEIKPSVDPTIVNEEVETTFVPLNEGVPYKENNTKFDKKSITFMVIIFIIILAFIIALPHLAGMFN